MDFRIARHTTKLVPLIHFYHELLGLEILGSFEDHKGYDGVFLGIQGESWHIEFTVSKQEPKHASDPDDLLVFYSNTDDEYKQLIENLRQHKTPEAVPSNPYWVDNGTTFLDPDGFRIVISNRKHKS
ncbi:VOC family protein [Limibacter armeniacum]|uniref:VOC family protein n=1 Tax=Limibacter armeniacum TaxID=466084 RepID=UPI002FE64B94